MSINYRYVVDWIAESARDTGLTSPRILDFGCGAGEIVKAALERGLDIWGADPYQGIQADLHERMLGQPETATKDRILRIEADTLPFPDNYFDIVVSNQVFEHVKDLRRPLHEIQRVLRHGGIFLALFPGKETWWEGHCQLYFAHWLRPPIQAWYLNAAKRCGFGYENGTKDARKWAAEFVAYLRDYCFYRPSRTIDREWQEAFGSKPIEMNSSYMLYRLDHSRLASAGRWLDNSLGRHMLAFICKARAGRVITVRNLKQEPPRNGHSCASPATSPAW